jgi:phage repressor protein C with HTH and peptisase S24 domain
MLSHDQVWAAIDRLAERNSLSASGLAKRAGLDSTAFNKSKRLSADGRPRWPSTESLSKVMQATGASLDEFVAMLVGGNALARSPLGSAGIPLLGFAQAGAGGFFDDAGFPVGHGWDVVDFPAGAPEGSYALKVQGDSMLPLYRDGDVLIVQPGGNVRRGDRVVVKTTGGEVMAKILARRNATVVDLTSVNPEHPDRTIPAQDVEWLARILWASQ